MNHHSSSSCKTCEATSTETTLATTATLSEKLLSEHDDDGVATTASVTKVSVGDEAAASIEKLQLKPVKIVKQRNGVCNHRADSNDDEVRVVHHPLHLNRTTSGENGLEYPEAFGLLPAYLKDMFLAAHFLRGKETHLCEILNIV